MYMYMYVEVVRRRRSSLKSPVGRVGRGRRGKRKRQQEDDEEEEMSMMEESGGSVMEELGGGEEQEEIKTLLKQLIRVSASLILRY